MGLRAVLGREGYGRDQQVSRLSDGDEHRQKRWVGTHGPFPAMRYAVVVRRVGKKIGGGTPAQGAPPMQDVAATFGGTGGPSTDKSSRCSISSNRAASCVPPSSSSVSKR